MFTGNSINDVSVPGESEFAMTLLAKLRDLDATRIASNDDIVLRKALLGLLEIVGELELRLVHLEGPESRQRWRQRLDQAEGAPTPDDVRLNSLGFGLDAITDPTTEQKENKL